MFLLTRRLVLAALSKPPPAPPPAPPPDEQDFKGGPSGLVFEVRSTLAMKNCPGVCIRAAVPEHLLQGMTGMCASAGLGAAAVPLRKLQRYGRGLRWMQRDTRICVRGMVSADRMHQRFCTRQKELGRRDPGPSEHIPPRLRGLCDSSVALWSLLVYMWRRLCRAPAHLRVHGHGNVRAPGPL